MLSPKRDLLALRRPGLGFHIALCCIGSIDVENYRIDVAPAIVDSLTMQPAFRDRRQRIHVEYECAVLAVGGVGLVHRVRCAQCVSQDGQFSLCTRYTGTAEENHAPLIPGGEQLVWHIRPV